MKGKMPAKMPKGMPPKGMPMMPKGKHMMPDGSMMMEMPMMKGKPAKKR